MGLRAHETHDQYFSGAPDAEREQHADSCRDVERHRGARNPAAGGACVAHSAVACWSTDQGQNDLSAVRVSGEHQVDTCARRELQRAIGIVREHHAWNL